MNQASAAETVAILGASPKPDRYAYQAMQLLREYGHRTIPINPAFDEILAKMISDDLDRPFRSNSDARSR